MSYEIIMLAGKERLVQVEEGQERTAEGKPTMVTIPLLSDEELLRLHQAAMAKVATCAG